MVVAPRVNPAVLAAVRDRLRPSDAEEAVPLWCPWPLPRGWLVTGVAWAGDHREPPRATALCVSGPAPFAPGPADIVFVAEHLGVGLGAGLAGFAALDAGSALLEAVARTPPSAKVRVDGHPTPLWSVPSGPESSVHVGEARAMWLYAIGWPAHAGYLLVDGIQLRDLGESLPGELSYGADAGRLRPVRAPPSHPPTAHAAPAGGAQPPNRNQPSRTRASDRGSSAERINQTGWN